MTETQPLKPEVAQPSAEERRAKLAEILGEKYQELKFEEERFSFQQRRAKLFAASSLFRVKDTTAEEALAQALVKIELGESMGFTPAEALQGIYIINGVTAISAALRASRMQAAGYSWDIEWIEEKGECAGCRLWLKKNGEPMLNRNGQPVSEAFLKGDALKMLTTIWEPTKHRASILEKDNWKTSPRNMYFARAVTNAQRFYAPHVLSLGIMSKEEAEDIDTEQPAKPKRATVVSIDPASFTASTDENRGHDQTQASPDPKIVELRQRLTTLALEQKRDGKWIDKQLRDAEHGEREAEDLQATIDWLTIHAGDKAGK